VRNGLCRNVKYSSIVDIDRICRMIVAAGLVGIVFFTTKYDYLSVGPGR